MQPEQDHRAQQHHQRRQQRHAGWCRSSRSSAHMPRVILRTVDPAKLLACQSVEKRCTRMKASRATSDMIRSVNGTMRLESGQAQDHRHEAERHDRAERQPRAPGARQDRPAPRVIASTRRPENTGMNRSATVAPSKPPAMAAASQRLIEPVAKHKGHHHADRGGASCRFERSWRHPATRSAQTGSVA